MAKRFNSASRIYSVLMKLDANKYQRIQPVDFWAEILGVMQENSSRKAAEVTNKLNMLHDELDLVKTAMEETDFSEYLYNDALKNLEQVISVLYLQTNWQSVAQFLKPEALLALNFCSEILPDETQQFNQSDIDELVNLLEALKQELNASQLPEKLVKLIQKHIAIIEQAIVDYQIQGYRAVENAVTLMTGDIVTQGQMIKANNDKPVVAILGRLYEKVSNVVEKVRPMIDMFNSIAGFIENVT